MKNIVEKFINLVKVSIRSLKSISKVGAYNG